ncbi:MAG: Nif3-like dinuclear metal center hexameric protein [Spirochaetaceae bacterium]|nr:Nif3-like dinuclear metal center hexameric protein [Spirochaetaceae bacterium]
MTLHQLDDYFRSFLNMEHYRGDPSLNGIQVENSQPEGKEIRKVAFAVDACQETISRAAAVGADLLFVHHGFFWGQCQTITGAHYQRIRQLLEKDMALYACHIPLDANELVGNNYGLARRLELQDLRPFGDWHGMTIGVGGTFPAPATLDSLVQRLFPGGERPLHLLPFGKKEISTVAIVSGGAARELSQAIEQGYDAFVTGEIGHEQYHQAMEAGINVVAGGHYQTETVGVSLVMEKLARETGIDIVFIQVPTGL